MISWEDAKVYWEYLEYYPEFDEEGYDGIHDGGVKGIREDAPEEAKAAYAKVVEAQKKGLKL